MAEDAELLILHNQGDGTFAATHSYTVPRFVGYGSAPELASVVAADFDSDGRVDLAVGDSRSAVSFFINKRDGTFELAAYLTELGPSFAAADFDGDGRVDLAAPSSKGLSIVHNRGHLTFSAHALPAPFWLNSMAAADLDGNGTPDLAQLRPPGGCES